MKGRLVSAFTPVQLLKVLNAHKADVHHQNPVRLHVRSGLGSEKSPQ